MVRKMSETIGFIGGGNMAEGIIRGLLEAGRIEAADIAVREVLPERDIYLKERYHTQSVGTLAELARRSEVIVLAVRPQDAQKVVEELGDVLETRHILVSICAGIQIVKLAQWVGKEVRIARIMPNTMIESGRGFSALAVDEKFSKEEEEKVQLITDSIGKTLLLPEASFDAFTATSCAGPEWLILFAAALIDAGVETGLSRADAKAIVVENLIATGTVLEQTKKHFYQLTDEMNTPGGIGIAGFHTFASGGLHGITMDAVNAAYERTRALGK